MSGLVSVRNCLHDIFGNNCEKITKADIKEAEILREDAEKGVDLAIPYAKSLVRELDLELGEDAIELGPLKKLSRMFEKAIGKYGSAAQLEELGDVGRLRILITGPDDVRELRRHFGPRSGNLLPMHPNNHVAVTKVQDYFWEPSTTGRIAFHVDLDVTISGGKSVGIEVQFVHQDMVKTDKASHANYQKAFLIERAAKNERRELTPQENEAILNYRESNQKMYLADALNYGLYDLRRPDLQRNMDLGLHLKLIA